MTNKFCSFLSDQHHFNFDLVRPCCWIRGADANIFDKEAVKAQYTRLSQVTDWIPECNFCKKIEDQKLESPRLKSLNKSLPLATGNDPTILEIQIDDTCNAACIMCGYWTSTTWEEYNQKTLKLPASNPKRKETDISDRVEAIKNIVNFDTARRLSFLGGEPFKTSTHVEILKEIKHPENVTLHYVTNTSIFPDEDTVKLLLSFKRIELSVSIDGIGDHFNYIRWPLQWKQVVENLRKFSDLKKQMDIQINTSFTINPFNIFYIKDYNNWAIEFGKETNTSCRNWFLKGHSSQGVINLDCIPPSLREVLLEKYTAGSTEDILSRNFDREKFNKFIEYIEFHDKARKLSWRDTFPEVADHFERLIGK